MLYALSRFEVAKGLLAVEGYGGEGEAFHGGGSGDRIQRKRGPTN